MSAGDKISLIVHTRDSAGCLPRLLASTAWLDERIVVDMASTDGTVEMAQAAGCRVVPIDPTPFSDAVRNAHLDEPVHPWTLVLDSDEHLADDAEADFRRLVADQTDDVTGIWIPRFNRIAGHVMRGSGWYPDHQLRLFRTGSVRYSERHHVPPRPVDPALSTVLLEPPGCQHIHHDNYASLQEMMERQLRYAMTDIYDPRPETFDFDAYLARGAEDFRRRLEPDRDGDMSYALALLMYWNEVTRGVVHWERLGHAPPLPSEPPPLLAAQPGGAPVKDHTAELEDLRRRVRRLRRELRRIQGSRSVRLTRPLRVAARVVRRLGRRRPS